jgi:hypothetical protein
MCPGCDERAKAEVDWVLMVTRYGAWRQSLRRRGRAPNLDAEGCAGVRAPRDHQTKLWSRCSAAEIELAFAQCLGRSGLGCARAGSSRDAATGTLAWTFVGDTALSYPPVIANGFVYVASDSHVYAVDISTHKQADQGAFGGWLTISGHRLIVAGADGTLSAYLLTE